VFHEVCQFSRDAFAVGGACPALELFEAFDDAQRPIVPAGGPPAEEGPGGPGKTKFIQP